MPGVVITWSPEPGRCHQCNGPLVPYPEVRAALGLESAPGLFGEPGTVNFWDRGYDCLFCAQVEIQRRVCGEFPAPPAGP